MNALDFIDDNNSAGLGNALAQSRRPCLQRHVLVVIEQIDSTRDQCLGEC